MSILPFLPNVASLALAIQNPTTSGTPTLVAWTRESSDDASVKFDLRFVREPDETDVGIAVANILMRADEFGGNTTVFFPDAGQFVIKAVSGPNFDVIGTSNTATVTNPVTPPATSSSSTSTDAQSTTAAASTTAAGSDTPASTTASITATPSASSSSSPTTTASPSPTTATTPSPPSSSSDTAQPTQTGIIATAIKHPNLPAIVGGVIGGLIVLGALAALLIFLMRRRAIIKKRLTFHRDMMVQSRSSPNLAAAFSLPMPTSPQINVMPPRPNLDLDLERGMPSSNTDNPLPPPSPSRPRTPLPSGTGAGFVVASPRGPRPAIRRDVVTTVLPPPGSPTPASPAPTRTRRQRELAERIAMLRRQISDMEREGLHGVVGEAQAQSVLEDMRRQMVWLREQEGGAWAMGLTDILPPGYARHMTP